MDKLDSTNPANALNMIDEQFNAKNINNNLENLVEQEMRSVGLDPLNKDDVKEFWRRKGIQS